MADRDDIIVEHHEREATVTVEWMAVVEVENRLFFPRLQPPVAGHLTVVLVGFAVTLRPLMVLARAQFQPRLQRRWQHIGWQ